MNAPYLDFDPEEWNVLAKVAQVLGTTRAEFVHDAAMQAADEVLGSEAEQIRRQTRARIARAKARRA